MENEEYQGGNTPPDYQNYTKSIMFHDCKQVGNISKLIERTKNFERWQESQNGALNRIEDNLNASCKNIENKIDNLSHRISSMEGKKEEDDKVKGFSLKKLKNRYDLIALIIAGLMVFLTLLNVFSPFLTSMFL